MPFMERGNAVHRAAVGAHLTLIALLPACILASSLPLGPRVAAAAVASVPLVLALPGLWRARRYTCQWLAVILVLYCGAAIVEVVAALGEGYLPALVLLAALVELGLVVVLSRGLERPTPRG